MSVWVRGRLALENEAVDPSQSTSVWVELYFCNNFNYDVFVRTDLCSQPSTCLKSS